MARLDWISVDERVPDNERQVQVFIHDPKTAFRNGTEWKEQKVGWLNHSDTWVVDEQLFDRDGKQFGGGDGSRLTHWAELPDNPDGSHGNPALGET